MKRSEWRIVRKGNFSLGREKVFLHFLLQEGKGVFVEWGICALVQYIKEGRRPLRKLVTIHDDVQFLPSNFRGEVLEGGKKEMFAFFVPFSGSSERALNWSITLCARLF